MSIDGVFAVSRFANRLEAGTTTAHVLPEVVAVDKIRDLLSRCSAAIRPWHTTATDRQ